MRFEKDRVSAALRACWSSETSRQWRESNPARGQCNVTALLVNELFGGDLLKTPLADGDHFYNRIDGERIDLTESQFEGPVTYLDVGSDRSEALAGTSASNYEALKTAFSRHLKSMS